MISLQLQGTDGTPIHVLHGPTGTPPRAVVQIVHGMAEHAGRYEELARALNTAGYAVYAGDLRGHGKTARSESDLGYLGDGEGWRACVADLGVVRQRIAADFPGVPVILLGHSMGSFLAQQFAGENPGAIAGLVLSGSYQESKGKARLGALVARLERLRVGRRGRSALLNALTFGVYNHRFAPTRTPYDWLSRDPQAVDRYIADPLCGFRPTVQMWVELLDALAAGLPLPAPEIPVCIILGELDPVCGPDPAALRLVASFKDAGFDRLSHCVYPGARHELFHETNRDEVVRDLVGWLDQVDLRREKNAEAGVVTPVVEAEAEKAG